MSDYEDNKRNQPASDDWPPYDHGINVPDPVTENPDQLYFPQFGDDMFYKNAYDKLKDVPDNIPDDMYEDLLVATTKAPSLKVKVMLKNILELALDGLQANYGTEMPPYDDGGMAMKSTVSADEIIARESVKAFEEFLEPLITGKV